MKIIPAIDIKNGKCVRLFQGDYNRETIYFADPVYGAQKWESQGAQMLHIIDLDGAKEGRIANMKIIKKITGAVTIPIQFGGGIRSLSSIKELRGMGISRIILGTAALEEKDLLNKAIKLYGEKIIVSLDVKNGALMKNGWVKKSKKTLLSTIEELKKRGVRSIIYTDIVKDGTLSEPNFKAIRSIKERTNMNVMIAGGISSIEQIIKLKNMDVDGVIIGRALYEGKINLKEVIKYVS